MKPVTNEEGASKVKLIAFAVLALACLVLVIFYLTSNIIVSIIVGLGLSFAAYKSKDFDTFKSNEDDECDEDSEESIGQKTSTLYTKIAAGILVAIIGIPILIYQIEPLVGIVWGLHLAIIGVPIALIFFIGGAIVKRKTFE